MRREELIESRFLRVLSSPEKYIGRVTDLCQVESFIRGMYFLSCQDSDSFFKNFSTFVSNEFELNKIYEWSVIISHFGIGKLQNQMTNAYALAEKYLKIKNGEYKESTIDSIRNKIQEDIQNSGESRIYLLYESDVIPLRAGEYNDGGAISVIMNCTEHFFLEDLEIYLDLYCCEAGVLCLVVGD